ncbi:MAG: phage tail protein [Sphingomonadaceae bacterium]|nr:phage tail protein [Sphingomonadaceae bacterium]
MIKPDSLRKAIERVLPGLAIEPDRLKVWIERGTVVSRMTPDFSFAWTYRLTILVEGMVEQPSIIAIAILDWLRVNQPALLTHGKQAFDFDADIIDNSTWDLAIDLDLEEQVKVVRMADDSFQMQHLAEPDPLFDDDQPLVGTVAADFIQAWLLSDAVAGGEKLIPDSPPLGADVQPPGAYPA